jgi:hypothetical protein
LLFSLIPACNGLLGDTYFTIHITPEPECSFVSFETNYNTKSFTALVKQVTETFRPGSFCLSLFVDEDSLIKDSRKGIEWTNIPGYKASATTHHAFNGGYNATCAHYEMSADHPHHGSASFGVPAATAAAAVKKAADSFDEHTALATQKLKEHLSEVVEQAKVQEAEYNKIVHEKAELEKEAKRKEQELLAKVAALEAQLHGAAPAATSDGDASMEAETKKRKLEK